MKVVIVAPGQKPEVRDIPRELSAMQEIVGGYIEAIYPFKDRVALVANEEGKLTGLPLNRYIGEVGDIIAGTFFICGTDPVEPDFCDLTVKQAETFMQRFAHAESFIRVGPAMMITQEDA